MTSVGLGVAGEKGREGAGKCTETPKNEYKANSVDGIKTTTETQRKTNQNKKVGEKKTVSK